MSDYEIGIVGDTEINLTVTPEASPSVSVVGTQGPPGPPGADGLGAVPPGGTTGQILAKYSNVDGEAEWIDPPVSTGDPDKIAKFGSDGNLTSISNMNIDDDGYTNFNFNPLLDDVNGSFDINRNNILINALQDSPGETWHLFNNQASFDSNNDGFDTGTGGQAFRFMVNNMIHNGKSDVGSLEFFQNNFGIGNGTDAFDFNGFGYMFGFGQINDNVTIVGPLQGYGFQPRVTSGATFAPTNSYVQAFYDSAQIENVSQGYNSFNASPSIAEIASGRNYNAYMVSPNIPIVGSNAGVVGIGIYGNYGTFGQSSYWQGVNINPNITSSRYAAGLNVSMDNVTPFPGVAASLVLGDLTFVADQPSSSGNSTTIEFTGGGTAGSEIVTGIVPSYHVQIEDGVSTATQIKAALDAYVNFATAMSVSISGVGSNPQTVHSPTNLTGGQDPGRVLAAYLDGDVEITGSLAFGGNLSIGKLSAFGSQPFADNGGQPVSVNQLISQVTVAPNTTVVNGDTLGINTAMLLDIGANSHVSSAFIGVSAMALPAVIQMGSGSTIDHVAGGTFALSLQGGAGGTIDNLYLCRALAIPNGTTTVTKLTGFKFELPFGAVGNTNWGFYAATGNNFFSGNLKIGGSDLVANGSVGLELEDKLAVMGRGTTTARDSKTPLDGAVWYNTTTNKFQGYANGAWVDFH